MFDFILLTHEGSHREVYRDFQLGSIFSTGGVRDCLDHTFCASPASQFKELATVLTQHLEQSHIQALTNHNFV